MNNIHRIVIVGDIMQHDKQIDFENKRNNLYRNIVDENILNLFLSSDSVIGNFETIIDEVKKPSGFPNFNVHKNFAHELKKIGFTDLVVSNNHSHDQGFTSFEKSVRFLENIGIRTHGHKNFGVRSLKNCQQIMLNATTQIMNNGFDKKSPVRWFDNDDFVPSKSLINIAYVHCGTEYDKSISASQRMVYRKLNKYKEYNAIFMVHSHVIGELNSFVSKDNCYVSNGLGNFTSQQKSLDKQKGLITVIDFDLDYNTICYFQNFECENVLTKDGYKTVSSELEQSIKDNEFLIAL